MRISDWSSDVCSSDLAEQPAAALDQAEAFIRENWCCHDERLATDAFSLMQAASAQRPERVRSVGVTKDGQHFRYQEICMTKQMFPAMAAGLSLAAAPPPIPQHGGQTVERGSASAWENGCQYV